MSKGWPAENIIRKSTMDFGQTYIFIVSLYFRMYLWLPLSPQFLQWSGILRMKCHFGHMSSKCLPLLSKCVSVAHVRIYLCQYVNFSTSLNIKTFMWYFKIFWNILCFHSRVLKQADGTQLMSYYKNSNKSLIGLLSANWANKRLLAKEFSSS